MNNWNFNEVTQQDLYDFKACKHNKTGEIYGIKDTSSCQSGKEVTKEEMAALAKKANGGDKDAQAKLKKYQASVKEVEAKAKKEKEAADKKKAAEGGKGKKGKGKKGGGKGKKGGKGKGGKGGGKGDAAQSKQQTEGREAKVKRFRDTVDQLQKLMKRVTDPKQRERLQQRINDVLKSVLDMTSDMAPKGTEGAQVAQQAKQSLEKKES